MAATASGHDRDAATDAAGGPATGDRADARPVFDRTVALVGLMGAGKTSIGRRLAGRLGLPFVDADHEIEAAAGCSVEEIFAQFGEAGFRDGERRVIARLMESPPLILATGGGAYIDDETRRLLTERALTIWLRADIEVLLARTARRTNRPLLKRGDPREILESLMAIRYPIYAEADVVVESEDVTPEETVDRVIAALERHLGYPLDHPFHAPAPGPDPGEPAAG